MYKVIEIKGAAAGYYFKGGGLYLSIYNVRGFLNSEIFHANNPNLVPYLEKAKQMMEQGETGKVII